MSIEEGSRVSGIVCGCVCVCGYGFVDVSVGVGGCMYMCGFMCVGGVKCTAQVKWQIQVFYGHLRRLPYPVLLWLVCQYKVSEWSMQSLVWDVTGKFGVGFCMQSHDL